MPNTAQPQLQCIVCQQSSEAIPVIAIVYQGSTIGICPQHLPILIHDPAKLVGILPGAEHLQEADHHDH